jgi:hypothetical protein
MTDLGLRQQVLGPSWINFELAPELHHANPEILRLLGVGWSPYIHLELAMGGRPSSDVLGQHHEQAILNGGSSGFRLMAFLFISATSLFMSPDAHRGDSVVSSPKTEFPLESHPQVEPEQDCDPRNYNHASNHACQAS